MCVILYSVSIIFIWRLFGWKVSNVSMLVGKLSKSKIETDKQKINKQKKKMFVLKYEMWLCKITFCIYMTKMSILILHKNKK